MYREIVQVCDFALDGLFQIVSLLERGVPPLLLVLISLLSPRCRRHCSLCSVGLLEQVKVIS